MPPRLARAAARGVSAALHSARTVERADLGGLLAPPADSSGTADAPTGELAARIARFTLRQLSRLPGSRWRATCLYASAAECEALRAFGVRAVVRLGVRNHEGTVQAHAWIERDGAAWAGSATALEAAAYQALRAGSRPR